MIADYWLESLCSVPAVVHRLPGCRFSGCNSRATFISSLQTATGQSPSWSRKGIADLHGAAIIREVHVYGQSLAVGTEQSGAAQHTGLGTRLLAEAEHLARAKGYRRMAVIAAVGTRQYYLERGFERGELYLRKSRF